MWDGVVALGVVLSFGGAFSLEDCWDGVGVEACESRMVEVSFLSDGGRDIVGMGNSCWTILDICQKCRRRDHWAVAYMIQPRKDPVDEAWPLRASLLSDRHPR